MPPASMAKLMTMAVVFGALRDGSLEARPGVRRQRERMAQGRRAVSRLDHVRRARLEHPVEDLIRGVIVQSGNDACIIIAEGMAGTQEAFADMMNQEADRSAWPSRISATRPAMPIPSST